MNIRIYVYIYIHTYTLESLDRAAHGLGSIQITPQTKDEIRKNKTPRTRNVSLEIAESKS